MNLNVLIRKRDYYDEQSPQWVRNIWSRKESLNHFIRYNRQSLFERGAIVKIGRDYFVDSEVFPIVVQQVLGLNAGATNDSEQLIQTRGGEMIP